MKPTVPAAVAQMTRRQLIQEIETLCAAYFGQRKMTLSIHSDRIDVLRLKLLAAQELLEAKRMRDDLRAEIPKRAQDVYWGCGTTRDPIIDAKCHAITNLVDFCFATWDLI